MYCSDLSLLHQVTTHFTMLYSLGRQSKLNLKRSSSILSFQQDIVDNAHQWPCVSADAGQRVFQGPFDVFITRRSNIAQREALHGHRCAFSGGVDEPASITQAYMRHPLIYTLKQPEDSIFRLITNDNAGRTTRVRGTKARRDKVEQAQVRTNSSQFPDQTSKPVREV